MLSVTQYVRLQNEFHQFSFILVSESARAIQSNIISEILRNTSQTTEAHRDFNKSFYLTTILQIDREVFISVSIYLEIY